ncbi:MAG: HAD family phosphatase [Candidatus Limivicinus sp.]
MSRSEPRQMQAVIFDMDGVIFDSEKLYIDCCVEAADRFGMANIVETCYRCIGVTVPVTLQILVDTYGDRALVDRFREAAGALFLEKMRAGLLAVKPGVRELLEYLKDCSVRTAVASSTYTDIVERELSDAGILPFFDRIVGGDQVSRSKPNPDIFLRAAETLDTAPEACLVIEDSYNGIRAAKAAGMRAIMVPDLLQPDEEMRSLADQISPSLLHVLDSLQSR